MRYPFYYPVLTLLLLGSLTVTAKTKSCKARLRANRGKTIIFNGSFQQLESSFRTHLNHEVILRHKQSFDSVFIYPDRGSLSVFTVSQASVSSPVISYQNKAILLTDSIDLNRTGAFHQYFGLYKSDHVAMTYNATENSRMYYSTKGRDSFFTAHYPAGNIRKTWYDSNGTDTATRQWSAAGVRSYYSNIRGVRSYSSDGSLETFTYDTLIADRVVSCRKTFYPDGTLRILTYHFQSNPCGTWLFYDRKGKLSGRKKYPAVDQLPNVPVVEAVPAPPEIFVFVEQQPEYPGGFNVFKNYVNSQLPALLCQSESKLSGNYEIRIQIDKTGQVNIPGVTGLNADQTLTDTIQRLFRSASRWKPGKRNGQTSALTYLMTITVQ